MHDPAMARDPILTPGERRLLGDARRAVLATINPTGDARLVPICHVLGDDDARGRPRLYTPIDEKPKARPEQPARLGRVRDILVLPKAAVLADRWDEDWSRLAWVRVYGVAEILEPQPHEREEHALAVKLLRDKYEQYRSQSLDDRPIIRVAIDRVTSWGALDGGAGAANS
jgi:coenzyme F420-0:L-glutamate ligase/coenzyme F420-1:gamma-L-glutamate ligase